MSATAAVAVLDRDVSAVQVQTFGYEGRTAEELVAQLQASNIDVLVDVRLSPISRKPGLSKTKLSDRLASSGIRYLHLRGLGNPKDNRAGFASGDAGCRRRFADLLKTGDGLRDLSELRTLAETSRVGLLCFEADEDQCHRSIIRDALT